MDYSYPSKVFTHRLCQSTYDGYGCSPTQILISSHIPTQRVMEVEQGTFTPLVVTVKGAMAPEASRFHKTLANKLVSKTPERSEDITRLIRVKLSFLVLRASLLCLRGSRTLFNFNSENCEDFAHTEQTVYDDGCSQKFLVVVYDSGSALVKLSSIFSIPLP